MGGKRIRGDKKERRGEKRGKTRVKDLFFHSISCWTTEERRKRRGRGEKKDFPIREEEEGEGRR